MNDTITIPYPSVDPRPLRGSRRGPVGHLLVTATSGADGTKIDTVEGSIKARK